MRALTKISLALIVLGSTAFSTVGPHNVLDHNAEKDTGALYHDTTKNINQSIALHNNAAAPAKVITTTKIKRIPKYTYYNVYKTKVVWKCITPPPVKITWTKTYVIMKDNFYGNGGDISSLSGGTAFQKGWTLNRYKLCSPCGTCLTLPSNGWQTQTLCGSMVQSYGVNAFYITAGTK